MKWSLVITVPYVIYWVVDWVLQTHKALYGCYW